MPAGQVCDEGHSGTGMCRKGPDFIRSFLSLPGLLWPHPVVRGLPADVAPWQRTLRGLLSLSHALPESRIQLEGMEVGSAIDSELQDLCFGCRKSPSQPALVWGSQQIRWTLWFASVRRFRCFCAAAGGWLSLPRSLCCHET